MAQLKPKSVPRGINTMESVLQCPCGGKALLDTIHAISQTRSSVS
jgi:hypothetical protein